MKNPLPGIAGESAGFTIKGVSSGTSDCSGVAPQDQRDMEVIMIRGINA